MKQYASFRYMYMYIHSTFSEIIDFSMVHSSKVQF